MEPRSVQLTQLELHATLFMGETSRRLNVEGWFAFHGSSTLRKSMWFCYSVTVFPVNLVVCCRLLITGPVSHYFYQLMEVWMPATDPYCIVKRLLLDRLFFAPGFLLIFYFVMNILEVGHRTDCPSLIISVEKRPVDIDVLHRHMHPSDTALKPIERWSE